jgi:anti-sigma regulatory factor (Ser/Thr protein kinase)
MTGDAAMSAAPVSESCTILPDADGIDRLHALLDRFGVRLAEARGTAPDREPIDRLTLALGEVVGNIARHAYRETATEQRWIAVRLAATAGSLRAELEDRGVPFAGSLDGLDETDPADPLALREGGRGLALIRQTVDAVTYERTTDGRNRWVLELHLVRR